MMANNNKSNSNRNSKTMGKQQQQQQNLRTCVGCGRNLQSGLFSKNQWSKGAGASRCTRCVNSPKSTTAPSIQLCSGKGVSGGLFRGPSKAAASPFGVPPKATSSPFVPANAGCGLFGGQPPAFNASRSSGEGNFSTGSFAAKPCAVSAPTRQPATTSTSGWPSTTRPPAPNNSGFSNSTGFSQSDHTLFRKKSPQFGPPTPQTRQPTAPPTASSHSWASSTFASSNTLVSSSSTPNQNTTRSFGLSPPRTSPSNTKRGFVAPTTFGLVARKDNLFGPTQPKAGNSANNGPSLSGPVFGGNQHRDGPPAAATPVPPAFNQHQNGLSAAAPAPPAFKPAAPSFAPNTFSFGPRTEMPKTSNLFGDAKCTPQTTSSPAFSTPQTSPVFVATPFSSVQGSDGNVEMRDAFSCIPPNTTLVIPPVEEYNNLGLCALLQAKREMEQNEPVWSSDDSYSTSSTPTAFSISPIGISPQGFAKHT